MQGDKISSLIFNYQKMIFCGLKYTKKGRETNKTR